MNGKPALELARDLMQTPIVQPATGHDQVGGECRLGRAHCPDVQVMHIGDAVDTREVATHPVRVDASRYRIERETDRIPQQPPGRDEDDDHDHEADRRV